MGDVTDARRADPDAGGAAGVRAPVLSKISYGNRMYKNVGVGRVAVRTYLIVSPLVLKVPRSRGHGHP